MSWLIIWMGAEFSEVMGLTTWLKPNPTAMSSIARLRSGWSPHASRTIRPMVAPHTSSNIQWQHDLIGGDDSMRGADKNRTKLSDMAKAARNVPRKISGAKGGQAMPQKRPRA